jgi:30S ribosomal protein S31
MGRGDKKTRKGKIFAGSFGNSRPHKVKQATVVVAQAETKEEKPKKARAPKAAKVSE